MSNPRPAPTPRSRRYGPGLMALRKRRPKPPPETSGQKKAALSGKPEAAVQSTNADVNTSLAAIGLAIYDWLFQPRGGKR